MKRLAMFALVALGFSLGLSTTARAEEGFKDLFDGKTLDGWKINENEKSWKVEDGAIVANGPRSHLFYVGDERPFKNFELKVDCWTEPVANGGIYFHSKFQEQGWPSQGIEVQVNNSYERDPRKTGSLYKVKDVHESPVKDREWYTYHVKVQDKQVTVKINDKTVVEYTEPGSAGKLDQGTFAFQSHDPNSTVRYKNVRVKRLE